MKLFFFILLFYIASTLVSKIFASLWFLRVSAFSAYSSVNQCHSSSLLLLLSLCNSMLLGQGLNMLMA